MGVCELLFPPCGGFQGKHFVMEEKGHRVTRPARVLVVAGEGQPVRQMAAANFRCAPHSSILDVARAREVEGRIGLTHLDFLSLGIGDVSERLAVHGEVSEVIMRGWRRHRRSDRSGSQQGRRRR